MITDLRGVHGVTETLLDQDLLDSLPATAPPAPWDVACEAIVWITRASRTTKLAQPHVPGRNVVVFGGFVRYLDTPVGPYNEVMGTVGVLRGRHVTATVPFMAVDSRESLVGGRQNWSLPKTLATFNGTPLSGAMSATGAGWRIAADARAAGPYLPTKLTGTVAQHWPNGALREAMLKGAGRARPALVNVEVTSDGPLPDWLRPGRHPGVVIRSATFNLSEPVERP